MIKDVKLFKCKMLMAGETYKSLAGKMQMAAITLSQKIEKDKELKLSEIDLLSKILDMSDAEIISIFLH